MKWLRRNWDWLLPLALVAALIAACTWSIVVNGPGWPFT